MEIGFEFFPALETAINFNMAVQPPVHGNMRHARSLVATELPESDPRHFTQIYEEHKVKVTAHIITGNENIKKTSNSMV